MSSEKAIAIVLKVVPFSETSSVVTLFTREFGKVRGLAKGARRPKGPFESALDLLAVCRVVFLRKSSEALDLLTEAKLERWFRPPRGGLSNLYAAYFVAELLNELTDDGDPHPELFDSAVDALQSLATSTQAGRDLVSFELAALEAVGHMPSLFVCCDCGTEVKIASRMPFGLLAGGVLCTACRVRARQVVSVSGIVIEAMRQLSHADETTRRAARLEARAYGELRGVLNRYWSHLLGHEPRMHRYLGSLPV